MTRASANFSQAAYPNRVKHPFTMFTLARKNYVTRPSIGEMFWVDGRTPPTNNDTFLGL